MDVLGRESAPINAALWNQIDEAVIGTARKLLTGRRFLSLAGPLGAGAQSVIVDSAAMTGGAGSGPWSDPRPPLSAVNSVI